MYILLFFSKMHKHAFCSQFFSYNLTHISDRENFTCLVFIQNAQNCSFCCQNFPKKKVHTLFWMAISSRILNTIVDSSQIISCHKLLNLKIRCILVNLSFRDAFVIPFHKTECSKSKVSSENCSFEKSPLNDSYCITIITYFCC